MADGKTTPDTPLAAGPAAAAVTATAAGKEERLCLVCGDRANGVHYNVLSCEGCKSFFLRSTKSKATFTCSQGGKCSMDLYTRRHCPACRMTRCVELGMNVDRVWDDNRLKTRKQLIRIKRKKKQPNTDAKRPAVAPTSTVPPAAQIGGPLPAVPLAPPPPLAPAGPSDGGPVPAPARDISEAPMSSVAMPAPAPVPEMAGVSGEAPLTPAGVGEQQWGLTEEQQNLVERLETGYLASKEVFKNIFPKIPGSVPVPDQINGALSSAMTSASPTATTSTPAPPMTSTPAPPPTSTPATPTTPAPTAPASPPMNPLSSLTSLTSLTSLLPEGMTPAMAISALASGELSIPGGLDLSAILPPGLAGLAQSFIAGIASTAATTSASASRPGAAPALGKRTDAPESEAAGASTSQAAGAIQTMQRVTSFITNGSMKDGAQPEKPRLPIHKEMLHTAMDMFAILVKQTIHFAKTIPGFMDLLCDDQAVLIKASIMDALLLRCAESYVPDMGCVINEMTNDFFHINMMYQMGYTSLPEQAFQFMKETKECGLTTAEYALLNAVAILSPDRTELHNRELVEEIQLSVVETLHAATKVFHQKDRTLFAKLIMKLTKMRDIAVVHLSDLMEVRVQEQDLSPLIVELFGLDSSAAS